jgi:hypothetical protein
MGFREKLRDAAAALLGVSAYQSKTGYGADLDDKLVEKVRKALGGQLQPIPSTRLRWYLADLETAQAEADSGNLEKAARLCNAMRRDGKYSGLLNTRTDGLVRMPKRFYGDETLAEELRSLNGSRAVFDEMVPPSESALLDADGLTLGVGIAELVPVGGREYPVAVRLDPEFLQYRWIENRWYYASVAGLLPITPGDGRWILHIPGGRMAPWRYGMWPALGKNFIEKDHAIMHRANYSAKLANPARVAESPAGATENFRAGMIRMLLAWGINSVIELPPGWKASLLESKGEGWKVFQDQIDTCDREYMVLLAGQEVTTTGGTGFSNQKMPEMIRQDLIAADAEKLAYTFNTQVIPLYTVLRKGEAGLSTPTWMQWSTSRAQDLEGEGRTLQTAGQGIAQLVEALSAVGREVDVDQLCERFGIPLLRGTPNVPKAAAGSQPKPKLATESTPEAKAQVERVLSQAA